MNCQPSEPLRKLLQQPESATWVYSYTLDGELVPSEDAAFIGTLTYDAFGDCLDTDVLEPLQLDRDANFCTYNRCLDPTVGRWINDDGSLTPATPDGR